MLEFEPMSPRMLVFCVVSAAFSLSSLMAAIPFDSANPLALPVVGSSQLRILSPTLLELSRITTKEPDPERVKEWDFVGVNYSLHLPDPGELVVRAGNQEIPIARLGFKRRVLYAPLKKRDLRIGNYLYVELTRSVSEGQEVEVTNPSARLWHPNQVHFKGRLEPLRWSPAIHINQVGYVPEFPKRAMVGFYLGSLGEMRLTPSIPGAGSNQFAIVEASSGRAVFSGPLRPRRDEGFTFPAYQAVLEADFSPLRNPGEYRLQVPGLGASFPFRIDEGVAAAFARTYALGLYHQRCGTDNRLPFTRFTHGPCHVAPAEVPTMSFEATQQLIKQMSDDYKQEPRHTAPQLKSVATSLYPFIRQGKVDVSGGHHDAGDYSKYTINSAALIHTLVFAADAFPGVGQLDNLGIPESGDGKSDLLEEAKWEADFLAKMQDDDGGFYFLVYPKERAYEDDVLPDHGDPQVVWPKTTSVTAAAVAALAQASSSPLFRKQFPQAAALYWEKAKKGWAFLQRAIAKYGRDGAYQKISHYGNEFMHDDELAWAAAEMFAATGDPAFEKELISHFNPNDRNTRRWTWWRMYEGYGCAIRSYAFAARTGRLKDEQLNRLFLGQCQEEILAAAKDQTRFARECAYGSSFPDPSKRFRNAGWYFSNDQAFDIAVAYALEARAPQSPFLPEFLDAMVSNLNYEGGCNPVNVTCLTGLGWKRQRDIVHQYAQNDRRVLPPTGIPIGNIQAGFQYLDAYKKELGELTYPPDGAEDQPYAFYDRWGDSFNVTTEFVAVNQARALAGLALLMAKTPLRDQPWRCDTGLQITGVARECRVGQALPATLRDSNLDLRQAQIVWEARDQEPAFGSTFPLQPQRAGEAWVEVEAQWPDGRRAFAVTNFTVRP
jgi:hypothetical protein